MSATEATTSSAIGVSRRSSVEGADPSPLRCVGPKMGVMLFASLITPSRSWS
jgi:hypothetical protein